MLNDGDQLPCPICSRDTGSLKQIQVIQTIVAFPFFATWKVAVYQSCPQCMRAYVWKNCLRNGLTTWIAGYIILVPYTVALTLMTLWKGHSWPVAHGVTSEMHLSRTWEYVPSFTDKFLAILAAITCLIPVLGVLTSWLILWKIRWCTGWVYSVTNASSVVAYLSTLTIVTVEFMPPKPG